MAEERALNITY
jgi:hypothetical protein